ncbi:50S ribosomal protein L29 [Candidatus Omnitrophota bacterium]
MKIKELRNFSEEELLERAESLKKEIFDLNFQRKYGKIEKPHFFRLHKKEIARIMTVLKEKEDGS